jgi:pentatricopeptide repeat protein
METVGVDPNVYSYTSALTAFARSKSYEGALEASALLEEMKELYRKTGNEAIKPTAVTYFAVIDAWARCESEEAGDRSEALLKAMEELYRAGDHDMRPDVKFYARVIAAHVKSVNRHSDEKALLLIRNMEKFCLTGEESYALAKPNIVCYNTIISSFARRRNAIGAFKVLNQMDQFTSRVAEEDRIIADEHTLNSVIYAISKSSLREKAKKALKMLERLETSHIHGDWKYGKPSTKSYNLVIATCSHSFKCSEEEKERALAIAFDVYNRLRASPLTEPDRYTYISMLKTCGKLLPANSQQRTNLVEILFRCCCEQGLVDDSVLGNFILAAPKDLAIALLGDNVVTNPSAADLPSAWTKFSMQMKPALQMK